MDSWANIDCGPAKPPQAVGRTRSESQYVCFCTTLFRPYYYCKTALLARDHIISEDKVEMLD